MLQSGIQAGQRYLPIVAGEELVGIVHLVTPS